MERKITSLTVEVDRLKQSDADKAKQLATLHLEHREQQKAYSSQIAELRRHCVSLSEELHGSQTLVEEKERVIVSVNAEVDKLKAVHATVMEQLVAERAENRTLEQIIVTSRSDISSLRERCKVQEEKLGSFGNDLQKKVALLSEQEHVITSLTAELEQAMRKHDVQEEQIVIARQEVERHREIVSVDQGEKANFQRQFGALSTKFNRLRNLPQGTDDEKSFRRILKEKEEGIRQLREELSPATSRYDDFQKSYDVMSRRLSDVSDQLKVMTSQYDGSEDTINSLTQQNHQLKATVTEKTEQLMTVVNRAQVAEVEVSTCTAQLVELRNRYELLSQRQNSSETEITAMPLSIKEMYHQIDILSVEGDQLKSANASKAVQISELQDRVEELLGELASVNKELQISKSSVVEKDRKIAILVEEVAEWKCNTETARKEIEDLSLRSTTSDALSTKFDHLRSKLVQIELPSHANIEEPIRRAFEEKERQTEELCEALGAVTSRYSHLEKLHEELSDKVNDLSDALEVKTSQYEGAKDTIDSLSAQTNRLRATVTDKTERLMTAINWARELQVEISTSAARSVNVIKTERVLKLEQDLSEAISSLQLGELQDRCKELSDELALVNSKLQTSVSSGADKDRTLAALAHEVMELKRANTSSQLCDDADLVIGGIHAFQRWVSEGSVDADKLIVDDDPFISPSNIMHLLIMPSSYEAAKKSIDIWPSTIGYVAKALSQIGNGKLEEAIRVFDLCFGDGNSAESTWLLLIKAIILFVAGEYGDATSRIRDLIAIVKDGEIVYCCAQVLSKMYLVQGDPESAVESLERGRSLSSSCTGRLLKTISIIFGWTFDTFEIMMQRCQCEVHLAAGRSEDAAEVLLDIRNTFGDIHANEIVWVMDLKKNCIDMLERHGDAALCSEKHEEAISHYSSVLSLDHSNPVDILLKRSKARALRGLWEDALTDADEVIRLDPSSHRGYERKYLALHGAENYGEANQAFLHMLSIIERSPDEDIRRLRENYTAPREAVNAIDTAIREIFHLCPLVLIDLTTGQLCDVHERVRIFKSETPFKKLVSETVTTKLDHAHIRQAVAEYFKWVMFSHTWEGKEPTFQDVNTVDSVWSLGQSPLNEKLRQFCATACEDGHRWAWSDTCCIDKNTSTILNQSLTSMYRWYEEAAETLVYLADVLVSAELGDLTKSRWMTRVWTLQELLASKIVRFYNREWKLYLNDTRRNHKESPTIKEELAQAIGVAPETITSFRPQDLGVREKLRLASTRNATVEEDIAYSLIGIFSSDIAPRYGLGKTALGQLLENIVARTGDVTVIAWTGTSSSYNSALPYSLAVYSQGPYCAPHMEANEINARMEQLHAGSGKEDGALVVYQQLIRLPRATFVNRCLQLPCIVFSVTKIGVQETRSGQETLYRAMVSLLGMVEFRTADTISLRKPRKLVLVHPWFHDLYDPVDEDVSDDEQEQSEDGSEDEMEAGSADDFDASTPATPLHAEPLARVDQYQQALQLIVRLGRPFNALLLELQNNRQYKRVASKHDIIAPGVSSQINPKDLRAKVLEVI